MSCDILPTDAPGPHYQGDVRDILDNDWDLMIAHPPCTYLSVSGMHWTTRGLRDPQLTDDALAFVLMLMNANIPKIALENPVSVISSRVRQPDQIVHPYQFGHDASKATCLWLKNLPLLKATDYIAPKWFCCGIEASDADGKYQCSKCNGQKKPRPRWGNQTASGQNKLSPSDLRWKIRSATYSGIANAMADQWGTETHLDKQLSLPFTNHLKEQA